jgi:hypothetical protein
LEWSASKDNGKTWRSKQCIRYPIACVSIYGPVDTENMSTCLTMLSFQAGIKSNGDYNCEMVSTFSVRKHCTHVWTEDDRKKSVRAMWLTPRQADNEAMSVFESGHCRPWPVNFSLMYHPLLHTHDEGSSTVFQYSPIPTCPTPHYIPTHFLEPRSVCL